MPAPKPKKPTPAHSQSTRMQLRELAQNASLDDLQWVMAVYVNRIGDLLHELKKEGRDL